MNPIINPNHTISLFAGIEYLSKEIIKENKIEVDFKLENRPLDLNMPEQLVKKQIEAIAQSKDLLKLSKIVESIDKELSLKDCEKEAPCIARYSLVTGQVCHTWQVPNKI